MNDAKIINDPVFGFIKIPRGLLLDIVQHPLMQRLTRIKQLGMANVVYPAAQHTRFQHSIGAFHLMSEAILSLQQKGHFIFDSEAEAVEAAILMHDIGHGPFSHVLENTLITGISHEKISLLMMEQINQEVQGALNLALKIFKGDYPKKFLHELISSQLDMDRLDYLRRDSFFTGVTEGNIGSARIIKMLDVVDDKLVVNSKGIYSIENYLTTRRLMYWQVYLHKTTVAFEKMLVNTLRRAKLLAHQGKELFLPCLLAWALPTYMISRALPERIDMDLPAMPYRGDDTNLNTWQRLLMLFVGIGGLWFIPTFHNITKLSPFLGAFCVLSVLWIVNEIFNHKLMNADQMIHRRIPRVLQYSVIQLMLFVMGIMMTLGVVQETGALAWLANWCDTNIHNIWILGILTGLVSSVLDNFATAMSFFSLYSLADAAQDSYQTAFIENGLFWKLIAYSSAIGGNFFLIGSLSGLALMKMERIHVGWYIRTVGFLSVVSWIVGMLVLLAMHL